MKAPPVLRWGNANDLRKNAGKIIGVIEANGRGNFGNAFVGRAKRPFRQLCPHLVDVDVDVDAGAALEDAAEIGVAAMAESGQFCDGDPALTMNSDVFQRVRKDGILAGIVITAHSIGMRLGAAQQMVGLAEILRKHFQGGEHMRNIDAGCADGLAVQLFRRLRVEARLPRAGVTDAAEGFVFLILEKSGVDGAN